MLTRSRRKPKVENVCPGCGKPCRWEKLPNGLTRKHCPNKGKCRDEARRKKLRAIYKAGVKALAGNGDER